VAVYTSGRTGSSEVDPVSSEVDPVSFPCVLHDLR
jgi:hypothetical protein